MSVNDFYTPIPTSILKQNHYQPIVPIVSTISASTSGTTSTMTDSNDNGSNHKLSGHEDKSSPTKPILNSNDSIVHPIDITLPENCSFASTKDNAYFHALFKSVPEHDRLLEVYKCALHRDILLQGHLYLSENYACFHANIFGWTTNLVIEYNEVTLIERKMTAMIIPNGIQINTQHAKHTFASFIFREAAYQQLTSLWIIQRQPPQSSVALVDQCTMNSDDMGSDDTGSVVTLTSDEDSATYLDSSGRRHALDNTGHRHSHSIYQIAWKIMLMVLVLLNSIWMIRKWTQLNNRLQHQYHHHHNFYQTLLETPGLSSFSYFEKPSHQHYHHHHPIYTKLSQLRQRMESLNRQIIDQQLYIYDISPLSTNLDSVN